MKRFILSVIFSLLALSSLPASTQKHKKTGTHHKADATSTTSTPLDTQIVDRRKTVDTAYERKVNHKAYLNPPDSQTIDRRMTVDTAYEPKAHHNKHK